MRVRGISQAALGEKLGLSQQVISFKLRKRQLTTKELIEVLDILEVEGGVLARLMGRG
jgi:transcriptional regulator with XRE-family HTH domain